MTRREKLMAVLTEAKHPIKGSQLAEQLGVSRQIVVQDIALLRAGGADIMATPQGYLFNRGVVQRPKKIMACRHTTMAEMVDELETIIIYGGQVLNVIVEHPVYGEIQGNLALTSLHDVQVFAEKVRNSAPLCTLTDGVHLHTIEAASWDILEQIEHMLLVKQYLISNEK